MSAHIQLTTLQKHVILIIKMTSNSKEIVTHTKM